MNVWWLKFIRERWLFRYRMREIGVGYKGYLYWRKVLKDILEFIIFKVKLKYDSKNNDNFSFWIIFYLIYVCC